MNGTVGVDGYTASVHASPSDVLSNFNFGIMGAAEIRYNRLIVPMDFMWVKLIDGGTLSRVLDLWPAMVVE
jgi:hypothetical protein